MGGNTAYSANSQNIKSFELKQKARGFLIILAIAVPVFLAVLAYLFYQDATKNKTETTDQAAISLPAASPGATTDPNLQAGSGTTAPGGTTNPAIQTPAAQPTSGIPAGVTAAMNSIEANGIKGNPYVSSSLDTSPVPVGTSVSFDRNSWTSYSAELGSANATISALGQSRNASITFGVTEGAWKATGYSLN